ncbi:MAG: AlpA family phage regulatory protein [Proteobacteria bacterium]|nr:AlpA family phage regulatory protein [Pseudomonadota bacterium]
MHQTTRRALRVRQVLEKTGLSRTHLYRLQQQGDFPPSVKLSERVAVWDEAAVDDWLAAKFSSTCKEGE